MGRLDFLYRMDLPHRAKSVYIYLLDRANKDGECWPAIPTIARELKLSQSTAEAWRQEQFTLFAETMIFSIPSFTKGDVCPLDGRWYLSSWREKANFPPEKILQQNKEHKKRMPPNEGGIIRQWQR